jgi:rhamnosyltransferase
MTIPGLCAVVVTYHPGAKMLHNISCVLSQVQQLVVVDNGSAREETSLLERARETLHFHLIANKENLGVAEAFNQGIRWAKAQGYDWVILFDQDSVITDGFISEMFAAWDSHPQREQVGSIHPRYVDPETGEELQDPRDRDGSPILPMTSGALMPTWIFERVGWFASEYFIDLVDWEYSFRIRAAGYIVVDSRQAKLLHSPGHPASAAVFGHTFHPSHHSAVRRYYIARNSIAFYRTYFWIFPRWILNCVHRHLHDTMVCLIAEQNRARKFRNFLLGTWDGLTGKMGKREGL